MHTILIVEDEAAAAMHLRKFLEGEGYRIVGQAFTGAQAVEKARSLRPELILMDIVLQGEMNGIEASEIVTSEMNTPILFISAYSDESFVKKAASLHPYGYILKPFQENQIKVAIEVAFKKIASDRQLRESGEKYHQMFQNTNEGMLVVQNGVIAMANQRAVEILGHPIEEIVSRPFFEFFHADDREIVEGSYTKRLAGQELPRSHTCRIADRKRKGTWVELSLITMAWEGKPAVLFLFSDITGRRLALEESNKYKAHLEKLVEERTEMLVKTSNKLQKEIEDRKHHEGHQEIAIEILRISQSDADINEMIEKVIILLKDWSGIEAVGFRVEKDNDYPLGAAGGVPEKFVAAESSLHVPDKDGRPKTDTAGGPILGCLCGDIISGRADESKPYFTSYGSFWTNGVTELLANAAPADGLTGTLGTCIGMGYESVALVPLRSETAIHGLIQFHDSRKNRFSPKVISLFEGLAELIAGSIDRRALQDPSEESAQKWRSLFESSRDVVYVYGNDGRFIDVNAAGRSLLGYTRDELLALHMKDIYLNERDRASLEKEIGRSGSVKDYPLTVKRKDGTSVDCLITSHVIRDAGGNVRCYQGILKERTGSRPQPKPAAPSGAADVPGGTEGRTESSHIFQNIVSRSPRILDIFKTLPQIARSDSTVLIEGKSGTGKELFARAIHNLSTRKRGPFVAINCAALPENLLESELFGYVKGAFTNAVNDKPGRFALAHGGTILLDEIGELSTLLQVKLLRAIQEKEIEPLGGVKSVKVDVRIISSTNRNISEEVRKGNFREDLFFRLNVVKMEIPELKDRRDDIPLLIDHILKKVSSKIGKEVLHVSDNATEFLMRYDYPGNVRELENIIESAAVMCDGDTISLEDIVNKLLSNAPIMEAGQPTVIKDVLTNAEKKLIQDTLARYDGDRGKTATLLNMDRSTLWRKMKKYSLS